MKKGLITALIVIVLLAIVVFVVVKVAGFISLLKEVRNSVKEMKEREQRYIAMSIEELAQLNDEELFSAISARVDDAISTEDDNTVAIESADKEKRVFYSAYWYEAEVNNGGLCQYFTNSSRATAPYLSETLEIIGAIKHKEHFDKFIDDNNIDVNDLSMFECEGVDEFEEKTKIFDFDEFDSKFYEMGSIEEYLVKYARENIDKF